MTTDQPIANEPIEMLKRCSNIFNEYANLHFAKRTPEGDEKAERNASFARECEAVIARAPSPIANEEELLKRAWALLACELGYPETCDPEDQCFVDQAMRAIVAALRTHTSTVDERGAVVGALRPFAAAAEKLDRGTPTKLRARDDWSINAALWEKDQPTVGDLRKAAEVLGHIAPLTTEVEVGPVSGSREPSPEGLGRSGFDPGHGQ